MKKRKKHLGVMATWALESYPPNFARKQTALILGLVVWGLHFSFMPTRLTNFVCCKRRWTLKRWITYPSKLHRFMRL